MKNKKKVAIISAAAVLAVVLVVAGIVYGTKNKKSSVVDVYSMDLLNTSDWFGEDAQLSGTITSDYVQEVYPNESEEVKNVYVKQGDTVKEGDKLIQYNVEEQELDLKLQELQIKSAKMEIERMEKELQKLKNTKTTGSVSGGETNLMQASLNLSSLKGSTLAAVMNDVEDAAANTLETKKQTITEKTKALDGYHTAITSVDQKDASSGDGSAADKAYIFRMLKEGEKEPTIRGSVLRELVKDKRTDTKYATLISYQAPDSQQGGTGDGANTENAKSGNEKDKTSETGSVIGEEKAGTDTGIVEKKTAKKTKAQTGNTGAKQEMNVPTEVERLAITPALYAAETIAADKDYTLAEVKTMLKTRTLAKDLSDRVEKSSDHFSGDGSTASPYLFLLRTGGTVQGSVLKELMDHDQWAEFRVYRSETDYEKKKEPEEIWKLTVKGYSTDSVDAAKTYTLAEAKALVDNIQLRARITAISDKAAQSGDGSANAPYIYLLGEGATVRGSVVLDLIKGEYTASFRGFKNEAAYDADPDNPKQTVELKAEMPTDGIHREMEYTLSALQAALKRAEEAFRLPAVLKTEIRDKKEDAFSGAGTREDHYQYRLISNGQIRGSVINDLMKNNEYGNFYEYASEEDGRAEKIANSIEIRPGTIFKETISSFAWYTIADLNDAVVTTDKIQIKPERTKVKVGKTYKFTAKLTGKNHEVLTVNWQLKRNQSAQTTLVGGVLTVGADETSESLRIIATAGGKKAVLTLKVTGITDSSPGDDDIDDGGSGGGDIGGGDLDDSYTPDELKDAIAEKEEELAEAKQNLNEAKINYQEAKKEVEAATVKAKVSGKVTVAYTKEAMPSDGSPAIVVRADDGIYVKVAIDEMALDTVKVGGTITCTSMESGEEYEAVVKDISEFPVSSVDSYDGMNNPNSSYYPVTAYIEDADGLKTGESVSVAYSAQSMGTSSEDMIYLQKAYVRTDEETKQSYVYKEGKNKRLKKQYVKTGKTIYGQYVEILSGVTLKDNIAFPYGKNVKEGAKVKISDNEENIIY